MVDRRLEIGTASLSMEGESVSGDQHLVVPFADGTLVGVVDGLGHGSEAAQAASLAVETLKQRPEGSPVALLRRCHEALHRTRGVALSLACFDERRRVVSWLGVGSVWGCFCGNRQLSLSRQFLPVRAGVVGIRFPSAQPAAIPLQPSDVLILATNGIRRDVIPELRECRTAQQIAEEILAQHKTGSDEAVVLVVRYAGPGASAREGGSGVAAVLEDRPGGAPATSLR